MIHLDGLPALIEPDDVQFLLQGTLGQGISLETWDPAPELIDGGLIVNDGPSWRVTPVGASWLEALNARERPGTRLGEQHDVDRTVLAGLDAEDADLDAAAAAVADAMGFPQSVVAQEIVSNALALAADVPPDERNRETLLSIGRQAVLDLGPDVTLHRGVPQLGFFRPVDNVMLITVEAMALQWGVDLDIDLAATDPGDTPAFEDVSRDDLRALRRSTAPVTGSSADVFDSLFDGLGTILRLAGIALTVAAVVWFFNARSTTCEEFFDMSDARASVTVAVITGTLPSSDLGGVVQRAGIEAGCLMAGPDFKLMDL